MYLGVRNCQAREFSGKLQQTCEYLATSRPTAVNLFWALERMKKVAREAEESAPLAASTVEHVKNRLLQEALAMLAEDSRICRAIGEQGVELFRTLRPGEGPIGVLTHCNAGSLAAAEYGTALAPIYVGREQGLRFHVYCDETRPLLQGSRLTAYELKANGIPATVICDNMAATVLSQGKAQVVIVGTDRVAANGDVANKIGTYGLAILRVISGFRFTLRRRPAALI